MVRVTKVTLISFRLLLDKVYVFPEIVKNERIGDKEDTLDPQ